jgi:N-acetylneuraminate synthase/N,N'-diacetyllegionaminate synthase
MEHEVLKAVEFIRSLDTYYQDPSAIAIMQCTSMYPIPLSDANLNVMHRLKSITGCTVGYSDHTEGTVALETAAAMGAEVLEFHFTDDRNGKTFRDHKVSLTQNEVHALIERIEKLKNLMGNSEKKPLEIEGDHRTSFRRAVYPKVDIEANTVLDENHLTVLRPAHGIPSENYYDVLGKKVTKSFKMWEKLDWKYLE